MAIEKSALAPKDKVNIPGTTDMVSLADLSRTGGLVNAYEAVKYADSISKNPNIEKTKLPKSKVKPMKKG